MDESLPAFVEDFTRPDPIIIGTRSLRAGIECFAAGRPASPLRQTVCPLDADRSEAG
ncbi:MAG: hypothetical protein KBE65_12765 [Phycisphaerae bacterium]|nr:hypothetical protein [Phycisphaerae bacterium]